MRAHKTSALKLTHFLTWSNHHGWLEHTEVQRGPRYARTRTAGLLFIAIAALALFLLLSAFYFDLLPYVY